MVLLSREHKIQTPEKAAVNDEWIVLGWTMGPITHHIEAMLVLAERDKHAQVAIVSRSIMELSGMFRWATESKERAKAYRTKTQKLISNKEEIWQQFISGQADKLSVFDKLQPKNDEVYRNWISASGNSNEQKEILDRNYDELSFFVHPSPIIAETFSGNSQELCQHYAKIGLYSVMLVINRAIKLQIVDTGKPEQLVQSIQDLMSAINNSPNKRLQPRDMV